MKQSRKKQSRSKLTFARILLFCAFALVPPLSCDFQGNPDPPKISVARGANGDSATITITAASGSVYWTDDGSEPASHGREYQGPITTGRNVTIKAILLSDDRVSEPVTCVIDDLRCAKPVIAATNADGDASRKTVAITCATSGAEVRYRINSGESGQEQGEWEEYDGPFPSPDGVVRAYAVKEGLLDSEQSEFLVFDASIDSYWLSGEGTERITIHLGSEDEAWTGADLALYATDGQNPSSESVAYDPQTGIVMTGSGQVKAARAVRFGDGADDIAIGEIISIRIVSAAFIADDDIGTRILKLYDAENAIVDVPPLVGENGDALYSREGFNLADGYWRILVDGQVTDGKFEDRTEIEEDVELRCPWVANEYEVVYHKDGSDDETDAARQSFRYGEEQALLDTGSEALIAMGFADEIRSFKGWATEPDGEAVYGNSQNVKNLTNENDGRVDLYAVWGANRYYVEFLKPEGAEGSMEKQLMECGVASNLDPLAFNMSGYAFRGWSRAGFDDTSYSDLLADGAEVVDLTDQNGATISLYAIFTPFDVILRAELTGLGTDLVSVAISAEGDDAEGCEIFFTAAAAGSQAENPLAYAKQGSGDHEYESAISLAFGQSASAGLVPGTAHIRAIGKKTFSDGVCLYTSVFPVDLTYVIFSFADPSGAQAGRIYETGSVMDSLPDPSDPAFSVSKTGYVFDRWTIANGEEEIALASENDPFANASLALDADRLEIKGRWRGAVATVYYCASDGQRIADHDGFSYSGRFTYGSSEEHLSSYKVLPKCVDSNAVFRGWSRTYGGSVEYQNGDAICNISEIDGDEVNFYPVLEIAPNAALTADVSANATAKATVALSASEELSNGLGIWFTDDGTDPFTQETDEAGIVRFKPSSGAKAYSSSIDVTEAKALKYALFLKADGDGEIQYSLSSQSPGTVSFHKVTLEYNDDNCVESSVICQGGKAISPPSFSGLSKTGYHDPQWILANGDAFGSSRAISSDMTLSAVWQANEYSVVFCDSSGNPIHTQTGFIYGQSKALDCGTEIPYIENKLFSYWSLEADGEFFADYSGTVMNLSSDNGASVKLYAAYDSFDSRVSLAPSGQGSASVSLVPSDADGKLTPLSAAIVYTVDGTDPSLASNASGEGYSAGESSQILAQNSSSAWSAVIIGSSKESRFRFVTKDCLNRSVLSSKVSSVQVVSATFSYLDDSNATDTLLYVSSMAAGNVPSFSGRVKTGYKNGSWSDFGADSVIGKSDFSVSASWMPISYSVKYDANGGTGSIADQSFDYDESKNLTSVSENNPIRRSSHVFKGWARTATATTAEFTDGQEVSNLSNQDGAIVILYAVWEKLETSTSVTTVTSAGFEDLTAYDTGSGVLTVEVGSAAKDIYLVFTNPTSSSLTVPALSAKTSASSNVLSYPNQLSLSVSAGDTASSAQIPLPDLTGKKKPFNADRDSGLTAPPLVPASSPAGSGASVSKNIIYDDVPSISKTVVKGDARNFYDTGGTNQFDPRPSSCQAVRIVHTDFGDKTLLIWVDNNMWGENGAKLADSHIEAIADAFLKDGEMNDIYDIVTAIFGEEWGATGIPNLIGDEDTITIFLTDIDDDLNQSQGGYTAGYFHAINSYRNDYLPNSYPPSNESVMFVVDAYAVSSSLAESISTLAHEFQHMIAFYQHNMLKGAPSDASVNEMFSMIVEDMMAEFLSQGLNKGVLGPSYVDSASGLAVANHIGKLRAQTSNYIDTGAFYGRVPDGIDAVGRFNLSFDEWADSSPSVLYDYGRSYVFGSYLLRNFGTNFLRAYVQSANGGFLGLMATLKGAFGGSDADFINKVLGDFACAALVSDTPGLNSPLSDNFDGFSTVSIPSASNSSSVSLKIPSINYNAYYSPSVYAYLFPSTYYSYSGLWNGRSLRGFPGVANSLSDTSGLSLSISPYSVRIVKAASSVTGAREFNVSGDLGDLGMRVVVR